MKQVLRFAKKYVLAPEEYYKHRAYMAHFLEKDNYTGENGYLVRSLYFDTLENEDYEDKVEGVQTRRKLRLRIYHPDADCAWLELKQKQGDHQLKRSLKVSREDAQLLCRGQYSALLHYPDSFAAECFALLHMRCYRPKSIVEYYRDAFIAPVNNTRVTFDRDIRATESNLDLFRPNLNLYPVQEQGYVVLEVKFNSFLIDYVKDMMSACERSQISSGKYGVSRIASMGPFY